MSLTPIQQLAALSDLLAARREAILAAWRKLERADPEQMTGRALTLGQFLDHIPPILDAYELRLRSRPGGMNARAAEVEKKEEGVKHGLHRWQQGYRLKELISECGHLQFCVFEELGNLVATHPELGPATLLEAHRQLLDLISDTISESAAQYERMQQAEAASRVVDLMKALSTMDELEQRRAALIHQAVHDLNNDVIGVSMAATLVGRTQQVEADRMEAVAFLERATQGLTTMLGELMELARLEAGQEKRKLAAFDAAELIATLCEGSQPFARGRNLYLKTEGPLQLVVEGDAEKVRRLAKNLVGNALKYTGEGGVSVSWGEEKENWWVTVKDTGPGMLSGAGQSLKAGLQEATASAKESDEKSAAIQGESSQVLAAPDDTAFPTKPAHNPPGEGIGLSIVKRLCELLDASLETASSTETGTTFRVVFPRRYRNCA
ncbi:MAG: HAMP domain-containing sensor histidine kinase [Verrucomicrobiae bacterium]|nr:HAMP domain-containing sensor histidine kinase [Verrucomicrobiae bacterium]